MLQMCWSRYHLNTWNSDHFLFNVVENRLLKSRSAGGNDCMGIEGQPGISRSSSNRTEPELVLDATIEGKDSTSHPFLHMNEKDVVWEMQVYGTWKNRGYQSHISDHSIKGRRYRREDRKRRWAKWRMDPHCRTKRGLKSAEGGPIGRRWNCFSVTWGKADRKSDKYWDSASKTVGWGVIRVIWQLWRRSDAASRRKGFRRATWEWKPRPPEVDTLDAAKMWVR